MIDKSKMSVDEILLEKGILNIEQLKKVWGIQRETGKKIEDILIDLQLVSQSDLVNASASQMEMDFVDLSNYDFSDYSIPTLISESMASRYCMIPIERNGDSLIVAMKDPTDIFATDDVRLTTGLEIKPVFAESGQIEKLISRIFVKETKSAYKPETDNSSTYINDANSNQQYDPNASSAVEATMEEQIYKDLSNSQQDYNEDSRSSGNDMPVYDKVTDNKEDN
ncbi:MAG: hypothetical protein Q8942_07200 [Bacillota bacterium]|nr:hypothetical protein [Bacillota bacterium]